MLGEVVLLGVLGLLAVFALLFAVAYLATEFAWDQFFSAAGLVVAVGVIGLALWAMVHA